MAKTLNMIKPSGHTGYRLSTVVQTGIMVIVQWLLYQLATLGYGIESLWLLIDNPLTSYTSRRTSNN